MHFVGGLFRYGDRSRVHRLCYPSLSFLLEKTLLGRLYLVSCSASESVWFGRESDFLYTAHYIQNPVFFLGGGGADRRPKILRFFVF